MAWKVWRWACLALAALPPGIGYSEESRQPVDCWLVNLSSETNAILCSAPALPGVKDSAGLVLKAGDQIMPSRLDAKSSLVCAAQPPLGTLALQIVPGAGPAADTIQVTEADGKILLRIGPVSYEFGSGGLMAAAHNRTPLAVISKLPAGAQTRLVHNDPSLKTLETMLGTNRLARWEIYPDGALEITAWKKLEWTFSDQDLQGWRYGATRGAQSFGVRPVPSPLGEPFLARPYDRIYFEQPLEWGALISTARAAGIYFRAAPGAGAELSPRGQPRTATQSSHKPRLPFRELSTLTLAGTANKPAVCRLMPVADLAQAKTLGASHLGTVLLKRETPDTFAGSVPGTTVRVQDSNRNGRPDAAGDRWTFSRKDRETMGLQFIPADADPRREGLAMHLSFDTNRNGRIDDAEWARPVWRLVDWNRDGRFFRGSLLLGGRLEQDAVYSRASGSPDGKLWDRQVFALDLDGDGDQDVTVRKSRYNYSENGEGGYGTASNKEGVQFDFGDGDYSMAVLLDPGAGKIALADIDYDEGEFFSRTADSSGAWAMNGAPAVWLLQEEHQEYDGFAPGDAAAHIWTYSGILPRLNFCGLGDVGNWNGGFDPSIDLTAWNPPVITYQDPWGHAFRFVSAIKPARWDGRALQFKPYRNGHLDAMPEAPWVRGVEAKTPARFAVAACTSFGVTSCEAYVEPSGPDGREEKLPSNHPPLAVYYSPLVGGLHALGAKHGAGARGVQYWDEDGDGFIDHYIWRVPDSAAPRFREVQYDSAAGRVSFRDQDRVVTWAQRFEFQPVDFYLENYEKVDALYRRGIGRMPLVREASLDAAGALQGTELPAATTVSAGTAPLTRLGVATAYAGGALLESDGFSGCSALLPVFARRSVLAADLSAPFSDASLAGTDIVLLHEFQRVPGAQELAALRRWLVAGGTLVIGPARTTKDQRLAANAVLSALDAQGRFSTNRLSREFRCQRIPDNGNIVGDIAEERVPSAFNHVSQFTDPSGSLLRDCIYINFTGWPVLGPAQPLLKYGDDVLIAWEAVGKGRVVLTAFPVFANSYLHHPMHVYLRLDNAALANNLLRWLQESKPAGRRSAEGGAS